MQRAHFHSAKTNGTTIFFRTRLNNQLKAFNSDRILNIWGFTERINSFQKIWLEKYYILKHTVTVLAWFINHRIKVLIWFSYLLSKSLQVANSSWWKAFEQHQLTIVIKTVTSASFCEMTLPAWIGNEEHEKKFNNSHTEKAPSSLKTLD